VLDDAVYREYVHVTGLNDRAGITLEAVRGATLALDKAPEKSGLLQIEGVPFVTVRGFHLRATQTPRSALVAVRGACPGLQLDRLELAAEGSPETNGVEVLPLAGSAPDRAPVVIRDCAFRGLSGGVVFGGGPGQCSFRTSVRDCFFADCRFGVQLIGGAQDVQVVGNRFRGNSVAAVQFYLLSKDSEGILIANNTVLGGATALRLVDSAINGKNVLVCNNLVLGSQGMDMLVLDAINAHETRGPGDGVAVAQTYHFSHNWREGKAWETGKGWIPPDPKKGDVLAAKIDGFNTDPKSPNIPRPDPKSPLASEGAGNEEPSLPAYVGALPPPGIEPWDWDRTWLVPPGTAKLLTVSKDDNDKKSYRTINAALEKAGKWDTIRVLDDKVYEETIIINDKAKHEGIRLEAAQGATLVLPKEPLTAITIADVPHVCLTGFTLRVRPLALPNFQRILIHAQGNTPGLVLAGLRLEPEQPLFGIVLQNIEAADDPVVVHHCRITSKAEFGNDGIKVVGPSIGVCIHENSVTKCARGVILLGAVNRIQVTGNVISDCPQTCLQIEDPASTTADVLIANNTVASSGCPVRFWENPPYPEHAAGQVEFANNICLGGTGADIGYFLAAKEKSDGVGYQVKPGDAAALIGLWHFHHNRRDLSGAEQSMRVPLSLEDRKLNSKELASVAAGNPQRFHLVKDSPLGKEGAGNENPSLPVYIGALPLEGVPAWDWSRTWQARLQKSQKLRPRRTKRIRDCCALHVVLAVFAAELVQSFALLVTRRNPQCGRHCAWSWRSPSSYPPSHCWAHSQRWTRASVPPDWGSAPVPSLVCASASA
jgi:hypothetical protein